MTRRNAYPYPISWWIVRVPMLDWSWGRWRVIIICVKLCFSLGITSSVWRAHKRALGSSIKIYHYLMVLMVMVSPIVVHVIIGGEWSYAFFKGLVEIGWFANTRTYGDSWYHAFLPGAENRLRAVYSAPAPASTSIYDRKVVFKSCIAAGRFSSATCLR